MRDSPEQLLASLFATTWSDPPTGIDVLRADGSNRQIYRLHATDGSSVIGVHGPDSAENRAFVEYSKSLRKAGIRVPEIFAFNEERHVYLEEDLGDTSLFGYLQSERERTGEAFPQDVEIVYDKVVEALPRIQIEGGAQIDYSLAWPRAEFDRRSIIWDLHYFKYLFLKLIDAPFDEEHLEDDFERLTDFLLQAPIRHFLYRDFQSRNIMLRRDSDGAMEPWFIDYQGGRRGALQYDLAAILYDAKANLPDEARDRLYTRYLDCLSEFETVDRDEFGRLFPGFRLVRALQALGAYGFRGLHEGKQHFIESIPYGIENVRRLLNQNFPIDLPELGEIFEWLGESYQRETKRHPELAGSAAPTGPVALRVLSFSYKQGSYPVDESEHGGGFVFDCRHLLNPGRLPEFVDKTGLDTEVSSFLQGRDDVEALFRNVQEVVSRAVETYRNRGFDYLSVAFGCTGGQHRSVYMAERLSRHFSDRPDVTVELQHRELP